MIRPLFIIAILMILLVNMREASAADRILVAGTRSAGLADIDERLIREETMRLLLKNGFAIVPVMELEREIRERGIILALLDEKDFFPVADKLGAQWVISGMLVTGNVRRTYYLNVFDVRSLKKYSADIDIPDGDFPGLCGTIAKLVADRASGLIRLHGSSKKP